MRLHNRRESSFERVELLPVPDRGTLDQLAAVLSHDQAPAGAARKGAT